VDAAAVADTSTLSVDTTPHQELVTQGEVLEQQLTARGDQSP
jgi:hypothetical protein